VRLISLRLREWRCYDDCTIEFPDGLIGIRGPNGAGKSTLAEAIGWALFGKLRHRAKVGDLRRQGAPKGARSSVELEFQLGSSSYRVERLVGGDAKLWINGELETQKSRDTNARIIQELDLTWDVFQRTVYAQQKDIAALDPGATGPQRKAHVERLLGLERFKLAAERARGEAKARANELTGLRQLASNPGEIEQRLKDAEAQAGDPAVAAAQAAHEEATRLRDETAEARDAEQDRANQFALLEQKRQTYVAGVADANSALARVRELLAEREVQAKRLGAIRDDADRLSAAEKALGQWAELEDAARDLRATIVELAGVAYDPAQAKMDQAQLSTLNDERTNLLEGRPLADADHARLNARLKALQAAAASGTPDARRTTVDHAEATLRKVREQLTIARQELEHDRAHVSEVEEGGPDTPCPVCRKPYGAEYDEILEGYGERIAQNEARLLELEETCARLETAVGSARNALAAAERASMQLAESSGPDEIAAAAAALAEAEAAVERIDSRLAELETEIPGLSTLAAERGKAAERWHELVATRTAREERLGRALKALHVDAYNEAAHAEAKSTHERIAPLAGEARLLMEALADVPHLEEEQQSMAARLEKAETALRDASDEITALRFEPDALERLKSSVQDADRRRDDAQAKLTAAQLAAQSRSQEVQELRRQLDKARADHTLIAEKQTAVRQYEVAADLLSMYRDGKAKRAWPRLEQFASALLNVATDGRYADVKLSDDYRLSIVDRGEAHELARYSGGEQDLANLCLRLAIADWVSKERNVDLGFVVLDEVFGSQDEERRQRLLGELRALSNRFRQMLVITHLPEIAELCDEQLEVTISEFGTSTACLASMPTT
jgi:exonuclease SbcC